MKKNVFILSVVLCILIVSSTFVSASGTINVKDYIKDKFPSVFSFYLSSLEDLNQYEKEFIDLLEELPEEQQIYYAKEVFQNGFSLELLNNVKEYKKIEDAKTGWSTEDETIELTQVDKDIAVPFKKQWPPGSSEKTKNCGPTSFLMVYCYHNKTIPTEQGIKDNNQRLVG